MASAFWTLEDGRVFSRRWSGMAYMLELITDELKEISGAKDFYEYLEWFVIREDQGDEYNGYGGFVRNDETIMFDIDLRTFAPANRAYFWKATQKALEKLEKQNNERNDGIKILLTSLLDMHKRIENGEDPNELNYMNSIEPEPNEKLGPGWN